MTAKYSEKKANAVQNPQTTLVLDHLDQLLGVTLAAIPDLSFKTTRFVPLGQDGFVSIYSKRCYPKAGRLFDRVEVALVDVGIKRVVFSGSRPLEHLGPLMLLIDDLVVMLGNDVFKKSGLNIRDNAGIKRGNWAGRRWMLSFAGGRRLPLLLDLMDSQLQLCLYLPV